MQFFEHTFSRYCSFHNTSKWFALWCIEMTKDCRCHLNFTYTKCVKIDIMWSIWIPDANVRLIVQTLEINDPPIPASNTLALFFLVRMLPFPIESFIFSRISIGTLFGMSTFAIRKQLKFQLWSEPRRQFTRIPKQRAFICQNEHFCWFTTLFPLLLFCLPFKFWRRIRRKFPEICRLRLVWDGKSAYACFPSSQLAPEMWCNLIESDHSDTLNWHDSKHTRNNQTIFFFARRLSETQFRMTATQSMYAYLFGGLTPNGNLNGIHFNFNRLTIRINSIK